MKCEQCSLNLVDEALICAHCGHDNAHQRVSGGGGLPPSRQTAPLKPEATLIHFPNPSSNTLERSGRTASEEAPAWRNQVRESVRLYREQRTTGAAEALVEEVVLPEQDQDSTPPIVEAALKRLRRPVATIAGATARQAVKAKLTEDSRVEASPEALFASPRPAATEPLPERTSSSFGSSSLLGLGDDRPARDVSVRVPAEPITTRPQAPQPAVSSGNPLAQPATLGDRALASIFDLAVIIVAAVPLFAIHSITRIDPGHGILYTILAILIWVCFIYQIWTMLVARRTCGMAWRNLKVVDAETHDFSFPEWRIFARSLAATVGLLLTPLNILVIWLSGSRASLADVLSRTTVCSITSRSSLQPPKP